MAKTLLLMRHAKSSWHDKDLPDYQRHLRKAGWKPQRNRRSHARERAGSALIYLPRSARQPNSRNCCRVCNLEQNITYVNSFYMGEVREFVEKLQHLDDSLGGLHYCPQSGSGSFA